MGVDDVGWGRGYGDMPWGGTAGKFYLIAHGDEGDPLAAEVRLIRAGLTNYPDDDFTTPLTDKWEDISNMTRDGGGFVHPTVKGSGYIDWQFQNDPMAAPGTSLTIRANNIHIPCFDGGMPPGFYPSPAPNAETGGAGLAMNRRDASRHLVCNDMEGATCAAARSANAKEDDLCVVTYDDEGAPVASILPTERTTGVSVETEGQWIAGPQFQGRVIVTASVDNSETITRSGWFNDPVEFIGTLELKVTDTAVTGTWTALGGIVAVETNDTLGDYVGFQLRVTYDDPTGPGTPDSSRVGDVDSAAV